MKLKPGLTLHSAVDATQVVVVRAPDREVTISCGGAPMSDAKGEPSGSPADGLQGGTQVGKRYADEELGLELLCTKPGQGTLQVDGVELTVKSAKPLPSSD